MNAIEARPVKFWFQNIHSTAKNTVASHLKSTAVPLALTHSISLQQTTSGLAGPDMISFENWKAELDSCFALIGDHQLIAVKT